MSSQNQSSSHGDTMTRPASPPPPPPASPPPVSPRPPILDRSKSAPAPVAAPDQQYFPRNRARTPSPNAGRDRQRLTLMRDWAQEGHIRIPMEASKRVPRRSQSGNLKHPNSSKHKRKSLLRRSLSTGSHHSSATTESYIAHSMASLFTVTWPADPAELARVQEFERVDANSKSELWYFAKELKYMVAMEVERNRAFEDGEIELDDEEDCCWRGLEHVWAGEDRSVRIKRTVSGIVQWHRDAKELGYNDPEELRVVSKARTKVDRSKAQKRATQDASYVKKLHKAGEPQTTAQQGGPKLNGPKKMMKRMSDKIISIPTLNWSPKPNKKTAVVPSG